MKSILSQKHLGTLITVILTSLLVVSTSGACELHLSKSGTVLNVMTQTQCIGLQTNNPITFIGDGIKTLSQVVDGQPQTSLCATELAKLNTKVLTVAPNKGRLTRPTYDMTATTKTGNTALVGMACEGEIIKYLYKTKSYYKIIGRNETALCGEY